MHTYIYIYIYIYIYKYIYVYLIYCLHYTYKDEARIATKINMRRQTIQNLQDRRQQDVDENVSYLLLENTQENLKRYIDSLNSKSKL